MHQTPRRVLLTEALLQRVLKNTFVFLARIALQGLSEISGPKSEGLESCLSLSLKEVKPQTASFVVLVFVFVVFSFSVGNFLISLRFYFLMH